MVHQRLSAVMPGADRNAPKVLIGLVQDSAEVVRMHPGHRKADDSGAVFWPEQVTEFRRRNSARSTATSAASCA
jgi:hypothetical protein